MYQFDLFSDYDYPVPGVFTGRKVIGNYEEIGIFWELNDTYVEDYGEYLWLQYRVYRNRLNRDVMSCFQFEIPIYYVQD